VPGFNCQLLTSAARRDPESSSIFSWRSEVFHEPKILPAKLRGCFLHL